jgi:hypothetical protein
VSGIVIVVLILGFALVMLKKKRSNPANEAHQVPVRPDLRPTARPANAFETNPLQSEPPRRHSVLIQNAAFAFGNNPTGCGSASEPADYLEPDSNQPAIYAAANDKTTNSEGGDGAGYDLGIIGSAAEYATAETCADAEFDPGTVGAAVKKEFAEYSSAETGVDAAFESMRNGVDAEYEAMDNTVRTTESIRNGVDAEYEAMDNTVRTAESMRNGVDAEYEAMDNTVGATSSSGFKIGVDAEYEAMDNTVRTVTHSSIAAANLQPARRRAASNQPAPKTTSAPKPISAGRKNEESKKPKQFAASSKGSQRKVSVYNGFAEPENAFVASSKGKQRKASVYNGFAEPENAFVASSKGKQRKASVYNGFAAAEEADC